MLIPVLSIPLDSFHEHAGKSAVKLLDQAISLGVVGCRVYLLNPQDLAHFLHESRQERLPPV